MQCKSTLCVLGFNPILIMIILSQCPSLTLCTRRSFAPAMAAARPEGGWATWPCAHGAPLAGSGGGGGGGPVEGGGGPGGGGGGRYMPMGAGMAAGTPEVGATLSTEEAEGPAETEKATMPLN